jgi:hypothetical protein
MHKERIKLILRNMELLMAQLKLELEDEDEVVPNNVIHIKDLITRDDYQDPDYYEEE